MIKLEIDNSGRTYCEVYIKPHNSLIMKCVFFKIDTGADFSTISKSVLSDFGYSEGWIEANKIASKFGISTASGEVVASFYVPLNINIYGIESVGHPFGIILDEEISLPKQSCMGCKHVGIKKRDYRLLLGNDILSCFDMRTQRDSNIMILEPRRNKTGKHG